MFLSTSKDRVILVFVHTLFCSFLKFHGQHNSVNIPEEVECRDAELILLIKAPFDFSQLARITMTAAQPAPQRAPIRATEQEQKSERVHTNAVWPAKATAHLINEAQPGGPCIAWADELTPSQCLLICPKVVVGKIYKALKTRERDYQCKLQDVKSSIQLKDLSADHLQRGLSAWVSELLVKAGWALLTSNSFLKPEFLLQNAIDHSLCRLQTQMELRSPHHILLRLDAGKSFKLTCVTSKLPLTPDQHKCMHCY